jgi:hypothetical protein
MRPRQLLAWLPALILLTALLAPTAAFATQTQTMHFSATDSRPEQPNPCSGALGTLTIVLSVCSIPLTLATAPSR